MRKASLLLVFLLWCCSQPPAVKETTITTPQNETLFVTAEGLGNAGSHKLAFIQHGLASNQQHQAVLAAKKAFLANGYVVVTFDSRHSLGKSSRDVENTRISTFAEDLSNVINWAAEQDFYSEPFALAGHSLGGASVWSYALQNPQKVDRLIGIAPVVSGDLWERSCFKNVPEFCQKWKSDGAYVYQTPDGKDKAFISYKTLDDAKNFNALNDAEHLKAITLLVAADNDSVVSPQDVRKLYDRLPHPKYIAIINDSEHNFVSDKNQNELFDAVGAFLKQQKPSVPQD